MKKLTLVAAAVLSAAATFAQTTSTQANAKAQTTTQVSADGQNRNTSAGSHTSGTAAISQEGSFVSGADLKGAAQTKAENTKAAANKAKNKSENRGKAAVEATQGTAATGSAKGKAVAETAATNASLASETAISGGAFLSAEAPAARPNDKAPAPKDAKEPKDKQENHGQAIAEVAHNMEATTTTKGQIISEVASANGKLVSEASGKGNTLVQVETPDLDAAPQQGNGKPAKAPKEKAPKEVKHAENDNHGQTVAEAAQTTGADVNAKGQVVKEVATARRQEKPVKLDGNVAAETATKATGAARVVTAGRPASAGRPARILKAGGAVKPVKVNGAVRAGSIIKVGKQ